MKSTRTKFDPSKLTSAQKKAFEISKAQGVKPFHSLKELALDIEPEYLDGMTEFLMQVREDERKIRDKDPFK
jgi:hypothetical protein